MSDRLTCGKRSDDPCCAVEIRVDTIHEALRLLDDFDRGILSISEVRGRLETAMAMAERDRWKAAA